MATLTQSSDSSKEGRTSNEVETVHVDHDKEGKHLESGFDGQHVVSASDIPEESQKVTMKTWIVITVLSSTFGTSFWAVPATSPMLGQLAIIFKDPTSSTWMIPAYIIATSLGFGLVGANSDLFGRRLFLCAGLIICMVGYILCATAKVSQQFIAGMAIIGFGAGPCQMAMCAVPELMPNKYRHIGVSVADFVSFFAVIVGPVVGRFAIANGNAWRFIYWGGFIAQAVSLALMIWLYYPPKHPKGVPWRDAIKGLDYIGAFLLIPGMVLSLSGIAFTTYLPTNSPKVIACLTVGLVTLAAFGAWERFGTAKYPLCPPKAFTANYGRSFTAPFFVGLIVNMFYYGSNIMYPTMVNVFYTTPNSPRSLSLGLSLPGNLAQIFGTVLLMIFGHKVGHWHKSFVTSFIIMVALGGSLAVVTPFNRGTMISLVMLMSMFFGWAQYVAIVFVQVGVHQHDLGVASGLSGMSRFAGASLAQSVYTTILTNTQETRWKSIGTAAAVKAGLPQSSVTSFLSAFPLGETALAKVSGVTPEVLEAAGLAFKWSYAHALKVVALTSVGFGVLGILGCLYCENIDAKMNNKTEVFLENDVNAEKNEFH